MAHSAFLNAAVLRLSIRSSGESLLPRFFGRAEALTAFLRAAVLPPSCRSSGESLLFRFSGWVVAHSAYPNAYAPRISSRTPGLYFLGDLPSWRIGESLNSCVLIGRASSVANNCLVHSIRQKVRGTPRLPGFAGDENICAAIRETTQARDGCPIGTPLDCARWWSRIVEHMGGSRSSTPYGFTRAPANNTSASEMGRITSTFPIEMAIFRLSGHPYAGLVSDSAILMRGRPASSSSAAELSGDTAHAGKDSEFPQIYRIALCALRVDSTRRLIGFARLHRLRSYIMMTSRRIYFPLALEVLRPPNTQ